MDSNHDKQIQNLQCYRYTTRQFNSLILRGLQKHPPRLPYFSISGKEDRIANIAPQRVLIKNNPISFFVENHRDYFLKNGISLYTNLPCKVTASPPPSQVHPKPSRRKNSRGGRKIKKISLQQFQKFRN